MTLGWRTTYSPGSALERRSPWADLAQTWAESTDSVTPPADYPHWLQALFPGTFSGPLASYHHEFWQWLWSVRAGVSPRPYVAVWARGWAKSTNAEVGVIALGRPSSGDRDPGGNRHYVLYVCSQQSQADDHVMSIAMHLESERLAATYPEMSEKWVGKFGNARGWRRNRLSTRSGFVVDGIGLDVAMRGAKLGNYRPDVIVLDDIDETRDSPEQVDRKKEAITRRILPAGAPDVAVLVAQNLVHRNGVVAQLVDGRADFLARRIVSGPHPAVLDLVTEGSGQEAVIVSGEPTWEVLGLAACQAKIALMGLLAFRAECQHEIALTGQPRFSLDALDLQAPRDPMPQRLLAAHLQGIEGLRVYSLPRPGVAYVLYTDPAEGKGRDYCGTCVMEAGSRVQVAVLEDNTREPQVHAEIAADLAEWYNGALAGYERAKGEAVAGMWGARGLARIYQHEDNPLTPQQRQLGMVRKLRPGYPMTAQTKRALVDRLALDLETGRVTVVDRRTLEQLRRYMVTERMTTEAEAGGHDDLVIALGGCDLLAEQPGAQTVRVRQELDSDQPRGWTWAGGRR